MKLLFTALLLIIHLLPFALGIVIRQVYKAPSISDRRRKIALRVSLSVLIPIGLLLGLCLALTLFNIRLGCELKESLAEIKDLEDSGLSEAEILDKLSSSAKFDYECSRNSSEDLKDYLDETLLFWKWYLIPKAILLFLDLVGLLILLYMLNAKKVRARSQKPENHKLPHELP